MEEQLKALIKDAVREVLAELENKKPKEILNARELAEWLGVSQAWVSVNKDNIPHFEAGGSKFYRTDIEKWIEDNKNDVVLERSYKPVASKVRIKVAKSKFKIS